MKKEKKDVDIQKMRGTLLEFDVPKATVGSSGFYTISSESSSEKGTSSKSAEGYVNIIQDPEEEIACLPEPPTLKGSIDIDSRTQYQ